MLIIQPLVGTETGQSLIPQPESHRGIPFQFLDQGRPACSKALSLRQDNRLPPAWAG